MNALRWLKKYNRHYDDIIIAEENTNWMKGKDEAEIPSDSNQKFDYKTESEMRLHWNDHLVNGIQQQDTGPAKSQVADVEEASDDITYRFQGAVSNQFSSEPTKKDDRIVEQIQNMARTATQNGNNAFCPFATSSQKGNDNDIPTVTQEEKEEEKDENNSNDNGPVIDDSDVINYPRVEEKAIDEYDPLEDIFQKSCHGCFQEVLVVLMIYFPRSVQCKIGVNLVSIMRMEDLQKTKYLHSML